MAAVEPLLVDRWWPGVRDRVGEPVVHPRRSRAEGLYSCVSLSTRRTVIPAPDDLARWPKPHVNTEAPRMATFTAVVHFDPKRRRSLTGIAGWRSAWVSDGLATPGERASRDDLYNEYSDDELERRWVEALPGERLERRFVYGLCGVSATTGWWAVLYSRRQQVGALLAYGNDVRAADVLAWPRLAVGLDRAGFERRWPAITQHRGPAPDHRRWLNQVPLYTPTALVHRMLRAGVAPLSMMTSNLALIDRTTVTFDGIPWFGFHRHHRTGRIIVVDVAASGHAHRLGPLERGVDCIIDRTWGATPAVVAQLDRNGIRLPAALTRLAGLRDVLAFDLADAGTTLRGLRLPALAVENLLSGTDRHVSLIPVPPSTRELIADAGALADGQPLGQLAPGDRLLAKPVNVPHLTLVTGGAGGPQRPADLACYE